MVRQSKGKTLEEFMESAKAVLEHMFGNHECCCVSFCDAKKAQLEGKPYHHEAGFCTRGTPEGEKMYQQILVITSKYGNAFFLRQSQHPFHANTNESIN